MQFPDSLARLRHTHSLAALTLAALLAAGCATKPAPAPVRPARTISPAQNWAGTYRGTVPCAPPATPACTSQRLALTLMPGNTYELETTVQRRGKPYTIVSKGRFEWDATRTVITLASKDENARLRINNGIIERLPGINDDALDINAYRGYTLRKH